MAFRALMMLDGTQLNNVAIIIGSRHARAALS